MKSAYEIAMEKLEKSSPVKSLSEAQLAEIRETDSLYQSKIAERKTFLSSRIQQARMHNDMEAVEALQRQLASDVAVLSEEMESKKEKIRNAT